MKADFSGEYVLNRQASMLSPVGAASVRSGSVHITHQEPRFRYQFTFLFIDGKTFEGAFDLTTDGREATTTERGHLTVSRLQWDEGALVFTSRSEETLTFRYELIDAGNRLRLTEQVRGTDHDQDNLWIFDRQ